MRQSGHLLAGVFCASFLTIQIVIPIVQLAAPRPARFGWHMWTARREPLRFFIVFADGRVRPADVSAYLASSRGEMDAGTALPPYLCRVMPGIAAVEIRPRDSDAVRRYRCP